MPPATFMVKPVSGLCNMQCSYCFYTDVTKNRERKSYGSMTTEMLEILIKKALIYAEGSCTFAFQGGEPTLAGLDFYRLLIKMQNKYNTKRVKINNSIQTNGLLIDSKWAQFLAQNNFLVGLSIDGTHTAHNKYRKTMNGIDSYEQVQKAAAVLSGNKVEFNVLCVVNNDVAAVPKEVYLDLKKHKNLQFTPQISDFGALVPSLDMETYAIFLKTTFDLYYKDFKRGKYVSIRNFDNYINVLSGKPPEQCGMAGMCGVYFLVEADGSVFPCDFYVLDEWKIGNVADDSFFKIAKSETARRFIQTSKNVDRECNECMWYGLCRGGCRRYREPMTGEFLGRDANCAALKSFFEYSYDRMVEIARSLVYN